MDLPPALAPGQLPEQTPREVPPGLRERALGATDVCLTITDPNLPDNPLIWVNPAFEKMTGYRAEDVLGRNCRFLQGPRTDRSVADGIGAALRAGRPSTAVLLNQRSDGTEFWNEISINPVFDQQGRLTHFVGVLRDVTDRVRAAREREDLLVREQNARAAAEAAQSLAEQAQRELRLLAGVSELMADTLTAEEALHRLAEAVVPVLGTWCVAHLSDIDPADDGGDRRQLAIRHLDPSLADVTRRLQELRGRQAGPQSPITHAIHTGEPELYLLDEDRLQEAVGGNDPEEIEQTRELYRTLGLGPAMTVPLQGRDGVLGALAIVAADGRPGYDADDLRIALDIGRRAGAALDKARVYRVEHNVAEALQRSLLPGLPIVPGLRLAARYQPASGSAQVGGDWYDVLQLPDGAVGVAVGDVMGHDLSAAAAMGQLRSVLRSYAWEGDRPGLVLDKLDRLVQGLEMAALATCLYARVQIDEEGLSEGQPGPALLRWANAGHLPPVLLRPGRHPSLLRESTSVLIGASAEEGAQRPEARVWLSPGSCLLLYTDGLVEARGHDVDDGLAELLRVAEGHDLRAGPEALVDRVLELMRPARTREDDIALLAVQIS
jgi:PAS domain S-box-containing protein